MRDATTVEARLEELSRVLEAQRAEIDRLRAELAHPRPPALATSPTPDRRAVLRGAGLMALGAVGAAGAGIVAAPTPASATQVLDDNLVVRGSSSPATRSEIGDGTDALTVHGTPSGPNLGSKSGRRLLVQGQARWDSDDDHVAGTDLDINKPALVLRQTGEDHKGAMIEFQQQLEAGRHPKGVATNDPGGTFDVERAGAKRVAWILAHYDSPNPADAVHQHLNFETCKADLQTIVTRFQISWGEDVALCSFPNSNVRVVQSDKVLSFGGSDQVRAAYRSDRGALAFEGDPVTFELGGLQIDDTWVSPTWFTRTTTDRSRWSTALLDDPDLQVPVAADATYTFTAFVAYRADGDADLRVAWAVPPGASVRWAPDGPGLAATGVVGPTKGSVHGVEPVNLGGVGTGTPMAFTATGIVRTAGAGRVQLRWGQDEPHPSPVTVQRDSFLQLSRVL